MEILIYLIAGSLICFHGYVLYRVVSQYFQMSRQFKTYSLKQSFVSLLKFSEEYRLASPHIKRRIQKESDPFLKRAAQTFLEGDITNEFRIETLENFFQEHCEAFKRRIDEVQKSENYLPLVVVALMNLCLVVLFQVFYATDFSAFFVYALSSFASSIGYVFAVHYFVLTPICESYIRMGQMEEQKNLCILEGFRAMSEKPNPYHLLERLNSVVPADQVINWEDLLDDLSRPSQDLEEAA